VRNLLLPAHARLAEDLCVRGELVAAVEQDGANDNRVRAHDLLVVVRVCGAVGAEVAVDLLARVAGVGVVLLEKSVSLKVRGNWNRAA
jgi:hypothetical protein